MSVEKMQLDFELWAKKNGYYVGGVNGYSSQQTDNAWLVWQASRAAIEVELPPSLAEDLTLIQSIESLGLKVKA
jgi:hypothetical protein